MPIARERTRDTAGFAPAFRFMSCITPRISVQNNIIYVKGNSKNGQFFMLFMGFLANLFFWKNKPLLFIKNVIQ